MPSGRRTPLGPHRDFYGLRGVSGASPGLLRDLFGTSSGSLRDAFGARRLFGTPPGLHRDLFGTPSGSLRDPFAAAPPGLSFHARRVLLRSVLRQRFVSPRGLRGSYGISSGPLRDLFGTRGPPPLRDPFGTSPGSLRDPFGTRSPPARQVCHFMPRPCCRCAWRCVGGSSARGLFGTPTGCLRDSYGTPSGRRLGAATSSGPLRDFTGIPSGLHRDPFGTRSPPRRGGPSPWQPPRRGGPGPSPTTAHGTVAAGAPRDSCRMSSGPLRDAFGAQPEGRRLSGSGTSSGPRWGLFCGTQFEALAGTGIMCVESTAP